MTVDEFLKEWQNERDYVVAHTSGSTGVPKHIRLPKEMMRRSSQRTIEALQLPMGAHLHLCLSPDYIAGKMMIVRAEMLRAILTVESPSNEVLTSIIIEHHRTSSNIIDLIAVVPSQLTSLLDRLDSLPEIRNIIVGGSAMDPSLRRRLQQSRLNAYETYGMTETASHVALRHISQPEDAPFAALPGITFEQDHRGCLIINLDGDRFVTNDIVTLQDPRHFSIQGRYDNVIISGGIKIHPEQLERRIAPLLPEGCVFIISSRPHEKWTNELILLIEEPETSTQKSGTVNSQPKIDPIHLLDSLRVALPHQECPKAIVTVTHLPRTATGKLLRR